MKILVALDDSIFSESAVDYVIASAWEHDDEIILLSVVETFKLESMIGGLSLEAARARKRLYKQHDEILNKYRAKIELLGRHTRITEWVVGGDAVEQILKWANDLAVDLIILGTHGRRGIKKAFLGSVSESVMKRASCKVEIVKTTKDLGTKHHRRTISRLF